MIKVLKRQMKLRTSRGEKFITQIEFEEHGKLMHKFRKQNIKTYWEIQSTIENEFLENKDNKQLLKMAQQAKRDREWIVKISKQDDSMIEYLLKKENNKVKALHKLIIQNQTKAQTRKQLLQLLEKESKFWLSNSDYKDEAIPLIPNNFESQSDYYVKLQEVF